MITSNARFDSVENSSPNPHQNLEKSQPVAYAENF